MAATDVEICNIALAHLGITQTISSIAAPTTKEERVFARFYPLIRKKLLARFPWSFARRRAALAETTTPVVTLDGWGYSYTLPSNFLKPWGLFQSSRNESVDERAPFELIVDDTGAARVLACDLPPVLSTDPVPVPTAPVLIYTIDIVSTTPTIFTPSFDEAFAAVLAEAVAMPLRVDPVMLKYIAAVSRDLLAAAVADNSTDKVQDQPPDAEYIRARS